MTHSTPYGAWPSTVTGARVAAAAARLGQVALRGEEVVWSEGRPQEGGRNTLLRRGADGTVTELLAAPGNARTRVHEYGGGAFVLLPEGLVYADFADQQLWRIPRDGEPPRPLTREPAQRYADACHDPRRERLIAVREDHSGTTPGDPPAALVAVSLADGRVEPLAGGRDFVAAPALSPDGGRLAWLAWDHPHMPWDAAELWLAEVAPDGALQAPRRIAGGPDESIFQPQWSPAGELHFVSDRSGWWNLYRLDADARSAIALHPAEAEFGQPQWVFGPSTYGFDAAGGIVCAFVRDGLWRLARLDPASGAFAPIETPYVAIEQLRVGPGWAVFVGATAEAPPALVRLELATGRTEVLHAPGRVEPDFAVSRAEPITFAVETATPDDGRAPPVAHAFYYPPAHRERCGPPGERPPLIVMSHGGPTTATDAAFKWSIQYWTSRGIAVVDVNYGGSTGYGRAYRERLDGRWGVVDVDDCIAAARFLVGRGDVDPKRLAIRGGSAGGYTTLCALTFRDFFGAGASHYGIGDLAALASDTHKFESRYLDRLVGPWPAAADVYRERSPIHHVDRLAAPMILLQGTEDKVVPPAQSEAMAEAVRAKGLPVAYLLFEGEQHGFRRAETIRRALEAELYFYGRVFGFAPADAIEPVPIANLGDG